MSFFLVPCLPSFISKPMLVLNPILVLNISFLDGWLDK
jgi:hypothetical protein